MGLFSFLSKNKQEAASAEGEFYSRAEEDSQAARGRGKRKQAKSANSSANASNNTSTDPVLPEKKRARRRLVGAIALVLAMIIGLPMLLDSEQKPVSDDIAIQIPSKDKPGALDNMPAPVSANSPVTVPATSSLSPQEQIVQMPKTPAASVPAIAPAPTSVKPVVVPPAQARNDAKPQPKPEVKADAKPESKPDLKPEVAHDTADAKSGKVDHPAEKHDDARAEAILDGKSTDSTKPAADKKGAKFVVQVAALATQEKVTELQDKLTQAGFKSFVQKVPTEDGVRIRVRVGPFGSKDEAESTRVKLSKLGFNGRLAPA